MNKAAIMDLIWQYWNSTMVSTNLLLVANICGALVLGLIVGYERSYHGRAAGMRTYGMVCMASAALTVFTGYPHQWFGGEFHSTFPIDPTRVIQGIVTGIGFLGAGVIMKDGLSISGLTTAASIWAASAIGILVGMGFYAAAILMTLVSASLMLWGGKIEARLPAQPGIAIRLRFQSGCEISESELRSVASAQGYILASGSFAISYDHGCTEWTFVAVAIKGHHSAGISTLAQVLAAIPGIEKFQISHARN